jgi:segregation and condensation protein A
VEYRVELDNYNGPMDLLLFLIKRDELDIYDIPIARITDSYMSYVHMLKEMTQQGALDINVAGEFLVMAASLMEIKSAMLLPRNPTPAAGGGEPSAAEELTDPRYELVQKLLEYKRFKDSAVMLERAQATHSQRFPRLPAMAEQPATDEEPPLDMEEVQIWDLLEAFNRLMREVGIRSKMHEVVYDDTPLDMHAAAIEERLTREPKLSLRQLILGRKNKSEMIGVFLAILELVREKRILVQQDEAHDDLEIVAAPEEHRKTFKEAMVNVERVEPGEEPGLFDAQAASEEEQPAAPQTDAESLLDDLGAPKLEEDASEEAAGEGRSEEGKEA